MIVPCERGATLSFGYQYPLRVDTPSARRGGAKDRVARRTAIYASPIVACELRFGARKKAPPRLSERVDAVLSATEVLPLQAPIDRIYADIRQHLAATGMLIGSNDMLMAAHTLTIEATLVTANMGEFSQVSGLPLENWLP